MSTNSIAFGHVERAKDRPHEIQPGVRDAGTDVEEPGGPRLREMQRHLDGIFDVDEVAPLLAVAILRSGSS